ncbi:amyotrophic lateral sclerosis 2 [Haematobia irritans]|uniref:amyotrophic lateral sclerosis 2 n=1 Tax=Haematobia irritans TaxID=7368 RepID=UPI003F50745B
MDGCGNMEELPFYIFFKGSSVSVEWKANTKTIPPSITTNGIRSICSITPQYFLLLMNNNWLYEANFDQGQMKLRLGYIRASVQDIQYCRNLSSVYMVLDNGSVLTHTLNHDRNNVVITNENWQTITFDPLELSEEGVFIKRVCCSSDGTLFVSDRFDIYALGNCGVHFSVESRHQPKMLKCFKVPMEIVDLSAGDNFFVFLVRKKKDTQKEKLTVREYGELPDLVCSELKSSKLEEKDTDISTSSMHSSISNNSFMNIQHVLNLGQTLLHTEIFTMGSLNKGLLGTGDHIKRETIVAIEKLKDIGVCSLATGRDHTVVRAIDGSFYHWGLNSKQQLTIESNVYELSSPTEFTLNFSSLNDTKENILEACCGDYRTVLLNTRGELFEGEKQLLHQEKDFVTLQMKDMSKQSFPLLLASSNLTIYNRRKFKRQYCIVHHHLQNQIRNMLGYRKRLICIQRLVHKVLLKDLQMLCTQWENVLYIVVAMLNSLEQLYRSDYDDTSQLLIVAHFRDYLEIFENYGKSFCDLDSIDGFAVVQKLFQQSPNEDITSSPSSSSSSLLADCNKDEFLKIFKCPLQFLPIITQFLETIQKISGNCNIELSSWLEFVRCNRKDMELAEYTRDFWQSNQKNAKICNFKRKERRVILSSSTVPIKQSHTIMGLTTPIFILFSDCLCQVVNHVVTYPLEAMWIKKDGDCGILIKTPEKKFTLTARNPYDKDLWYDQLESSIKSILNLPEKAKIPEVRSIQYNFSTHSNYSGANVKGNFSNAVMHGKCVLKYPNGKIYSGDVIHGVIEGYGRMFLPKVGLYKGYFKNGKFCGNGTLIIREKEIYEGNFRNGLFNGHGHMQTSEYIYVGEFQDNLKWGYGVLDNLATGDKYIGMFADNKKSGPGICVTASGNYFEGLFANDELSGGKTVAIFPNQYFYEGESGLNGPNGLGKYYMPKDDTGKSETNETYFPTSMDNVVVGNILSGQLSGTWENVKINNGSIEINVNFPKYPSSFGSHIVNNSEKWCSLFKDFENEIFEDLAKATTNTSKAITFALWNRIISFITKQHEIENEKMTEFDIMNSSTPPSTSNTCRRDWSVTSFDVDKLSLNSSTFSYDQKSELNKSLSHSDDTLLNGLEFYNLDLLSTFGNKFKRLNNEDTSNNSTFPNLIAIMENCSTTIDSFNDSALSNCDMLDDCTSLQSEMELIPPFGLSELTEEDLVAIKAYLKDAFRYRYHPLKHLNDRITYAFYRSYGCWKIKPTPLLAKQAMREWESISQRMYKFIRRLFPALPEEYCVIGEQREVVSHVTLLYPIVLSESIYSMLFVLYANQYSDKDELYRQNLMRAEKLTDEILVHRLEFDNDILAVIKTPQFSEAVQMLNELKEKYSPMAMLTVIENCMEKLTHAYQQISRDNLRSLNADLIMPLTLVLLLRAGIHHLGAELALLDDLTDSQNFQFEMNGIRGYCLTTLKASYEHLTNKSLFENN